MLEIINSDAVIFIDRIAYSYFLWFLFRLSLEYVISVFYSLLSDSTEPIDGYLKFYPPTLVIRPVHYVNTMRSSQDSSFVTSRTGDAEVAKIRSTVLATRRRLNDKSVQRSNSSIPLPSTSASPSVSMPYWSLPPSVFDPSSVPMPVHSEARASYERK